MLEISISHQDPPQQHARSTTATRYTIPGFTFHRGGCFFALISIFTVFGRFFLHIHLLCMMGRLNFQTIIELCEVTGCEVRK